CLVVSDKCISPGGRNPLSISSSHSYPSVVAGSVATCPGRSVETVVLRQSRSLPYGSGTVIEYCCSEVVVQQFTVNRVPVSEFSGRPPFERRRNRGTGHVPVHSGLGSILALVFVSL